jgi:hypothetical protein
LVAVTVVIGLSLLGLRGLVCSYVNEGILVDPSGKPCFQLLLRLCGHADTLTLLGMPDGDQLCGWVNGDIAVEWLGADRARVTVYDVGGTSLLDLPDPRTWGWWQTDRWQGVAIEWVVRK